MTARELNASALSAKALCEKVLADYEYWATSTMSTHIPTGDELADAAPLLAKMLMKAIEQRDLMVMHYVMTGSDSLITPNFNAELDAIASGEASPTESVASGESAASLSETKEGE